MEADVLGALPIADLFRAIAADLGINLEQTGLPPEIQSRMPPRPTPVPSYTPAP